MLNYHVLHNNTQDDKQLSISDISFEDLRASVQELEVSFHISITSLTCACCISAFTAGHSARKKEELICTSIQNN